MNENRYSEAVVTKPVEGVHAFPRTKSELVTQVILGTPLVVGKQRPGWLWVTGPDTYRGWIAASATRRLRLREPRYASRGRVAIVERNKAAVHFEDNTRRAKTMTITVGTQMEFVKKRGNRLIVRLPDKRVGWVAEKDAEVRTAKLSYRRKSRGRIVETAKRFLGVPYLWGGTTPFGLDCSGFVQLSYRLNGVALPRDADQQFQVATPISVGELRPADLLFFSNRSSGITHVGMFVGEGRFIHASGKHGRVALTPLSDQYFQSIFVQHGRVYPDGKG